MRSGKLTLRAFFSILVAVVFTVAATPGTMAMPAPATHQSMDGMAMPASHCDHMKPVKQQGSPCKHMQVCMGMLGCFGMAAVMNDTVIAPVAASQVHVPGLDRALAGLTLPPDDRPPIA